MHVGLLTEHSDPARGGAERYVSALADRLRAHGHAVSWRARTGPAAAPVPPGAAALRPGAYARVLLPALRAAGADVVLATVPVPGCEFYQPHHGIFAASIPPHLDPVAAPWRWLRRANPYRVAHFAILRGYERRAVRPPAEVLALSPRVVADLARLHPVARATLLRPGVDLERFRPGGRAAGGPRLLFVAHNERLKGLPAVLRALARLPRATLVVAGDGPPIAAPRVERRPFSPALYREADLLVHPTWYDTAALVVLEALASGVAPITTVRDGNADLAVEGGGAALDDPGDDAALAVAIERAYEERDSARARAVAERFDESAMLDRVVERITCASSS